MAKQIKLILPCSKSLASTVVWDPPVALTFHVDELLILACSYEGIRLFHALKLSSS